MATPILSHATYQRLSGDTTTVQATAEAAMLDAESLLGDVLDRILPLGTYVERVKISPSGHVTPRALPLVSVPASASYQIGTDAELRFVSLSGTPFFDTLDWRYLDYDNSYPATWARETLQYTGGYTEATLPFRLARAICALATAMVTDPSWNDPTLISRTVGDVSVTRSSTYASATVDSYVPGLCATIRGFKRRVP